jgi:hypothetical protein
MENDTSCLKVSPGLVNTVLEATHAAVEGHGALPLSRHGTVVTVPNGQSLPPREKAASWASCSFCHTMMTMTEIHLCAP